MKTYERYYRINKWSMLILGQWPFRTTFQNRCQRVFIYSILISIVIPKVIKFVFSLDDLEQVILCMPMLLLHSLAHTKYFILTRNTEKMRALILSIEKDWDTTLGSKSDRDLLHRHHERGRRITSFYASTNVTMEKLRIYHECLQFYQIIVMFTIVIIYLTSPGIPLLMDIISPLNVTRPRIYLYETEYFVDQEDYYFEILMHSYVTIPLMGLVTFSFDNMLASYISHANGLFEIASEHLKTICTEDKENGDTDESSRIQKFQNQIIYCTKIHRRAIEFTGVINSSCGVPFLFLIGLDTILITLTGMVFVMNLDKTDVAFRNLSFTIGGIIHLFYSSFHGTSVIESSNGVFRAAYTGEWYNLPPRSQKLLIPIMMRCSRPCQISAADIYILSMETFSDLLRKAGSFFTMLNSVR